MMAARKKPPPPGEIRLGMPCPRGHIPYERVDEQGRYEQGVLERCSGTPNPAATSIIRMGEPTGDDTRKVVSVTRLTPGPARVTSEAYRTGWDAIFAKPPGKPKRERPN